MGRCFHCSSAARFQRLLTSVWTEAKLLSSRLIPFILTQVITNRTQKRRRQRPQTPSLPGPSARIAGLSGLDCGEGDGFAHWLVFAILRWQETKMHQRRNRVLCSLSVSGPNNAINEAEQRSSRSLHSKRRLWVWNAAGSGTPRSDRAASLLKDTLYLKV